ncbi:MAG: ATP synthase F0 subunit B [Clostridia bacterium]|nr:ATP synthase F0 subunit B [Clostridia bacterium]
MNIPLNINLQQILLHLLNFMILFTALYFILYKPVKDFMNNRQAAIREKEEQAAETLLEAEKSRKEAEERVKALEDELKVMKAKAHAESVEEAIKVKQNAEQDAEAILNRARASANIEKERILESAKGDIEEMVTSATEKILREKTTSEVFDEFLNEIRGI